MNDQNNLTQLANCPDMISVSQLKDILHIGSNSAYRLLKEQKIRSIRIGSHHRIPRSEVIRFIEGSMSGDQKEMISK